MNPRDEAVGSRVRDGKVSVKRKVVVSKRERERKWLHHQNE